MVALYSSSETSWLLILVSTVCWTVFYYILYSYIRKPEVSVRLVTLFHALTSVCLCFYICVVKGPFPLFPWAVGLPNTWWQNLGIMYSLGYFIFDLVWSLYMQTEKPIMLVHHVVSILGFLLSFKLGLSGCEILATTGGAEVSNPFLQWRWRLQQEQRLDTDVGKFVEHMFLLMWFVVRLGIGTVLYIVVILSGVPPTIIKVGANCMFMVSCTFTYGIIKYYRKKFGSLSLMPSYFVKELPKLARSYWNIFKSLLALSYYFNSSHLKFE